MAKLSPVRFRPQAVGGRITLTLCLLAWASSMAVAQGRKRRDREKGPPRDPELAQYAIYGRTAPRAEDASPVETSAPLRLHKGDRIAFIGNLLLEREQHFAHFESLLHLGHPGADLVVRNLCWPADTPDLQPRPANFADVEQHLRHERIDVVFAAFGFNESFAGESGEGAFRASLSRFVDGLRSKAFNGSSAPRVVLLSPIANENVPAVSAADRNNGRLAGYSRVVRDVANELDVLFVDVFTPTRKLFTAEPGGWTFNGAHLTERGYETFAKILYEGVFERAAPVASDRLRAAIIEKNRQYFRRYRPVNTFYYTGGRNKSYGYLDFLPAMRNFDILVENRDRRIWRIARGQPVSAQIDDSNVPALPATRESRGANTWLSAADELAEFRIDPRFEVNLFAGEEQFPDIAAPIQMRWDARGRLWVSCSTTYPHVYPGSEPNDKIVILEDTDGDGRADRSSVFADDLHIPLSFEFGDGGLYVSEEPHLTFLKDTDGDGRADLRRIVLTGFGCEDSHHALHDFVWSPDGDLVFREAIFHHSQVETPYGPVRQQNSGWFRFVPREQRLSSFGTYPSTNPWGVTFDRWGQHVASHPIYAAAFHSPDPPYPQQHARPAGLRAYSGTCGQEFVDFATFPEELQGGYVKVRYKPTNRVEIHEWNETEFGFDEKYVSDLIFSKNLSFIPVDIRFGPRGALYICDWYNPIKGHAQYSLRDSRRDRHSGRIWRVTTKGRPLVEPPKIASATTMELLDLLKRREYRYRYWAKRELRERDSDEVRRALDRWVASLDASSPDHRHHQLEAIWCYRSIGESHPDLLRLLLRSDKHLARAAALRQLRSQHYELSDSISLLRRAANDPSPIVRMEAAIAASHIGSKDALDALLDVAKHPRGGHLSYALTAALSSQSLRRHWEGNDSYAQVRDLLRSSKRDRRLDEKDRDAVQAQFDTQKDLKSVRISCVPERMKYSVERFTVRTGQPVKLVFVNPDATDHNLVIVEPGALEEVGMAANDMAKDPKNASSDFIPADKKQLILRYAPMIGPTRKSRVHVLRFHAPKKPGVYPYVCTFPGHWVVMTGEMVVAESLDDVDKLLAASGTSSFVKNWSVADFEEELPGDGAPAEADERRIMRGYKVFRDARCNQCHAIGGHGAKFGPDLTRVSEKYRGAKLLRQILEPSSELNETYRNYQFILKTGEVAVGTVVKETEDGYRIAPSLLDPSTQRTIRKADIAKRVASEVSPMPESMLSKFSKVQVLDLLAFLEAGGYQLPEALRKKHSHGHEHTHEKGE